MPKALIDVHAHLVPGKFPPAPGSCDCWPRLLARDAGHSTIYMGSKPFRELDSRSWDASARLASMDAEGITTQVLSPMPELLSYWMAAADALTLARHVNATIAEFVTRDPAHFQGFGMVPLQDPGLATRELARLRADGLRGVEIGSHVNGVLPSDARFEEFFAEAARLGLAVFIHALHPVGADRLAGTPDLIPFAAFPLDTALAAASLMRAGTLERHPGLRIGLSHGGGAIAALVPRLQRGWELTQGFDGATSLSPVSQRARFFYDSVVYDPDWLRYLMTSFAPGQFFAGTDYPFAIQQTELRSFLEAATDDVDDPVYALAAQRFLGLEGETGASVSTLEPR